MRRGSAAIRAPAKPSWRGGPKNCTAGRRACVAIRSASCCNANRAPWPVLAAALPALRASRERPASIDDAFAALRAVRASASSTIAATLFGGGDPAPGAQRGRRACSPSACSRAAMRPRRCNAIAHAGQARRTRRRLAPVGARPCSTQWPLPHGGSVPGRLHAGAGARAPAPVRRRRRARAARCPPGAPLLTSWRRRRGAETHRCARVITNSRRPAGSRMRPS